MRIILAVLFLSTISLSAKANSQLGVSLGVFNTNLGYFGDVDSDGDVDEGNVGSNLSGMFDLGIEYTYKLKKTMGVGALFKYLTTSDETATDVDTTFSAFVIGGVWRHYLRAGATEFSIGGGLGYMSATIEADNDGDINKTTEAGMFSPFFLIEGTHWFSDKIGVGIEHGTFYALGDTWNGIAASDWVVKGTFGF